ncbi:hypothetical protein [Streptomyces sp. NPDC002644]
MAYIDVSGTYQIKQSNGYTVNITMYQQGDRLSGVANHSGGRVRSQEVTGSVSNEHVDFYITWQGGSKGHYWGDLATGFFTSNWDGILKGRSQDVHVPSSSADWEVPDRVFRRLVPA